MAMLLWILAVILVVSGIFSLIRGQMLWGILLIVVGLLVGPGGVSIFTGSHANHDGRPPRGPPSSCAGPLRRVTAPGHCAGSRPGRPRPDTPWAGHVATGGYRRH